MTIRYCDKQSSADATKPCPHVALVGTRQCLEHREPGALVPIPAPIPLTRKDWLLAEQPDRETRRLPPVPTLPAPGTWAETERMLVRLGQLLDARDFAAAHDSVRPEIADAIQAATEEHLTGIVTTTPARAEPLTLDDIMDVYRQFGAMSPPPEPIRLTREQIDALPLAEPSPLHTGVVGDLFGTPVELVDTVEESTPFQHYRNQARDEIEAYFRGETIDAVRRDRAAAEQHQRVIATEATEQPSKYGIWHEPTRRTALEPRRSIGARVWQTLRRWAR